MLLLVDRCYHQLLPAGLLADCSIYVFHAFLRCWSVMTSGCHRVVHFLYL